MPEKIHGNQEVKSLHTGKKFILTPHNALHHYTLYNEIVPSLF